MFASVVVAFVDNKLKEWLRGNRETTHPGERLVCGAGAGAIAQSITFPMDTVRKQLQTKDVLAQSKEMAPKTMTDCIQRIWRTCGVAGFYRGFTVNLLRAGPSQAVQFMTCKYDWVSRSSSVAVHRIAQWMDCKVAEQALQYGAIGQNSRLIPLGR